MGGFPELVHRRGGGGGVEKDEEEGKWRVCGGEGVRERERNCFRGWRGLYFAPLD